MFSYHKKYYIEDSGQVLYRSGMTQEVSLVI
jgi:hypothetical protein